MKRTLLLLSFFFVFDNSFSQDAHLSQFFMSPLTLNPALTGVFNGCYRVTGNFRNQWASAISNPYTTAAGAFELSAKSGDYNRIGIGLHVLSDQAGISYFTTNIYSGSLAYNIALSRNRDYYISTGLQLSYTQRSINPTFLTWGSQYNNGQLDGPVQDITSDKFTYVDAAAGFVWYHINPKNRRNNQFLGLSVFHANQANITFIQAAEDNLYTKFVGHAGLEFRMAPKMGLSPYLVGMLQGPSFETEAGAFIKFILEENKKTPLGGTSFYVGPFYRLVGDNEKGTAGDAVILAMKLDIGSLAFGVSYDVNISSLSPATSSRGGPELSIQYIGVCKHVSQKIYCPRF